MTYDRGTEMACHPELARRLKIDIWFCDPHAPWQRGSNENTNGLLRQFFSKGRAVRPDAYFQAAILIGSVLLA